MIEKNIVDRVPTHAGRIKLTPVDGQTDFFTMERADEPTVAGTPIDKATIDSIIQSRLTGRFYTPSVTRTVASARTGITVNPLPKSGWANVTYTQATNGEYKINASSSLNSSYQPDKATDGSQSTSWTSAGHTGSGQWWQITLPIPIIVSAIKANLEDLSGYGQTFIFQGSANGTAWTELTRGTFNRLTGMVEYTFNNETEYSYYRMYFTGYDEYSTTMVEFEISKYSVSTYNNKFVVSSGVPVEWTIGQRITIKTPSNVSTAGTLTNTLNGKNVNTILQPSRNYELRYNGTSFDAKEV